MLERFDHVANVIGGILALPLGEQRDRIRAVMNPQKTTIAMRATLLVSIALADDFKTINGKEYKNATVSRVEPDGIVVKTKSGISKIYFAELPKEVQQRFGHDPEKIEAANAAARAAEAKRVDEEKKREENAEADLKRSLEQFQAAEQRAAQNYQNATKGTLSGQIFVTTKGAGNYKLGAVKVGVFARDAMDAVLVGLKRYADIKIQQLRPSLEAERGAYEQATTQQEAAEAAYIQGRGSDEIWNALKAARETADKQRQQFLDALQKGSFYYSGGFYFAYLLPPVQATESDAEGKFTIEVPQKGDFVIAAQAERSVVDGTEHYYWVQPVSLDGQPQHVQNLSTNNLTSTTGSSSLIHTQN